MANTSTKTGADADLDAREALWRAIREGALQLAVHCTVSAAIGPGPSRRVHTLRSVPGDVPTWKLVEAISLLSILLVADRVDPGPITLFSKLGPVGFEEPDGLKYAWTQQQMSGERSNLGSRPDLVVTSSPDPPTSLNVVRIIDAKCVQKLGSQDVRGEFAKAHDLRVESYFIWTYYAPPRHLVDGARRFGLDLEQLGFDSPDRQVLIDDPQAILSRVCNTLKRARDSHRFATSLEEAAREATLKLPPPRRRS